MSVCCLWIWYFDCLSALCRFDNVISVQTAVGQLPTARLEHSSFPKFAYVCLMNCLMKCINCSSVAEGVTISPPPFWWSWKNRWISKCRLSRYTHARARTKRKKTRAQAPRWRYVRVRTKKVGSCATPPPTPLIVSTVKLWLSVVFVQAFLLPKTRSFSDQT